MKTILVLSFLVAGMLQAQVPYKNLKENGVYLADTDYLKGTLTYAFNKDEGFKFKENRKLPITIKTSDTIYKLYKDEIWGYRKKGIDWRLFNEEFYRVDYIGKICIYTLPGCSPCSISSATLYFSSNINSPLHQLTKKNLKEVYHTNTAFVQKVKNLPFTTSIEKWDKKNRYYEFINWL